MGGQANLRPSWATYYQHTDCIIMVLYPVNLVCMPPFDATASYDIAHLGVIPCLYRGKLYVESNVVHRIMDLILLCDNKLLLYARVDVYLVPLTDLWKRAARNPHYDASLGSVR